MVFRRHFGHVRTHIGSSRIDTGRYRIESWQIGDIWRNGVFNSPGTLSQTCYDGAMPTSLNRARYSSARASIRWPGAYL